MLKIKWLSFYFATFILKQAYQHGFIYRRMEILRAFKSLIYSYSLLFGNLEKSYVKLSLPTAHLTETFSSLKKIKDMIWLNKNNIIIFPPHFLFLFLSIWKVNKLLNGSLSELGSICKTPPPSKTSTQQTLRQWQRVQIIKMKVWIKHYNIV